MERQEWEAWLANPVTRSVVQMLKEKHSEYLRGKQNLDPRGFEDAHNFFAASLVLMSKAESYQAMIESLTVAAYDEIF